MSIEIDFSKLRRDGFIFKDNVFIWEERPSKEEEQ